MIEARGLTRRFGGITAVDGVDLVVERPGVVGFLGPNGAGKTTTMRMLTGFLAMTEGTAVVAGFDVFEDPIAVKARVGYLPELPPLYPDLSVGEYLGFVAEIRGVPRARRLARVGEVMEQVGLGGTERRLLGGLSKGYRQRVGLAQAIVHDPPVLVLDEPTSGLDPAQLPAIRQLVRDLARDRVVLLSTHVLPEVEQLCERVVVIHRGRIVGDGTVDQLAEQVGGGPWVELVVAAAPVDATAQLAALDVVSGIEALPAETGTWRYRLRGGPGLASRVAAVAGAWELRSLAPRRATLTEVFLELVEVET